jgi:glycosyltransferase involved in cell wall biosynthesis
VTAAVPVAVNLLWCRPGRVGGSEEYLVRQLLGLADLVTVGEQPFAVTAYAPAGFAAAHPELRPPIDLVEGPRWAVRRPARVAAEHSWLAGQTRRAALVHHGGGTAPRVGTRPFVLTVHDLQFLTYPEYVHPVKLRYLRRAVRSSVRRAAVTAVPSEYVRRSVLDAYGTDPARVVVVPHGFEPPESDGAVPASRAAVVRARYGLGDERYLVLPAITHPHKGHRFLLDVLARTTGLRLVLLGGRGAADADVEAAIGSLGLASRVVRLGRVPDADRDAIVADAEALVFPSEYEGFGAPVLEAMALGTPVICSDRTSLPEVAGDAALVTPLDADAWLGALDALPSRRAELIAAGRARAATFTLRRSAEALSAAYRLALT